MLGIVQRFDQLRGAASRVPPGSRRSANRRGSPPAEPGLNLAAGSDT